MSIRISGLGTEEGIIAAISRWDIYGTGSAGCPGACAESNVTRIGTDGTESGQQDATWIGGIYNRSVGATNAEVCIDSDGKLGTIGCPNNLPAVEKHEAALHAQQSELHGLRSLVAAQQNQIETLRSQLQLQNAAFQERLTRLEFALSTQMAAADNTTRTAPSPDGGRR